jgi:hypothetical protein
VPAPLPRDGVSYGRPLLGSAASGSVNIFSGPALKVSLGGFSVYSATAKQRPVFQVFDVVQAVRPFAGIVPSARPEWLRTQRTQPARHVTTHPKEHLASSADVPDLVAAWTERRGQETAKPRVREGAPLSPLKVTSGFPAM